MRKAGLVDSRDTVRDIEFAPKHLGLMLAVASADGTVRVYQATDVTSLTFWSVMHEFEARKGGACVCLSWNPSRYHSPLLAVGTEDPAIKIWEHSADARGWSHVETLTGHTAPVNDVAFAPNMGRSFHLLASCSKDGTVIIWRLTPRTSSSGASSEAAPATASSSAGFDVAQIAIFDDHEAEVGKA